MSSVKLAAVRKSFGPTDILHGIDLDIADGEFVVFVGPSGCGKSTLLRLICGLDEVTSGVIAIDGEIVNDVPPAKRGIAMVFQSYALYPHMTVAKNMGYSLRLAGVEKREIERRVGEAAAVLRLDQLLDRKPRQLSGGQRQRVAIGRAIVRQPRIFLFDEPLSNLDAALRVDMRAEIASLKARLGVTMIYVTHDQTEAMTLADKIVVLNAGRIEQVGSPLELYRAPANKFVAGFIGSPRMNMLPAIVGPQRRPILTNGLTLPFEVEARPGDELSIGARAEHLTLATDSHTLSLSGRAKVVEHLGSDLFVHVVCEGVADPVIVRKAGDSELSVGSTVRVGLDPAALHLFDESGQRISTGAQVRSAA
ncbi:sn-glycerol-3-phosphate ABC transporter ATP-binding protein UgpC [Terrarubrum flagellatum]|uniref:ABC transporter ATP-binding protein n=1 Tax=Terrirubrum flagellatum TaxID=2895980 RepID=UPI0031453828